MSSAPCPCGSGEPYAACCRPFHRGLAEPPLPAALVRARFCAFALKEVDFLVRTLDAQHPDRSRDEGALRRELRDAAQRFRYIRLTLLDAPPAEPGSEATVTFHAELFEKGKPRGFQERSVFRHDGKGWRYLRGDVTSPRPLP